MEGAIEVLAFHHFQTHLDKESSGPTGHSSSTSVQDAYTIFCTQPVGGPQARTVVKESTRFSKSQARAVAYEDARPSKRRKKDPNRPRGYISAFNFFVQDKRRTYVQNRPNAKVTLGTQLSATIVGDALLLSTNLSPWCFAQFIVAC